MEVRLPADSQFVNVVSSGIPLHSSRDLRLPPRQLLTYLEALKIVCASTLNSCLTLSMTLFGLLNK
jgi:hypothetical protein